MGERIDFGRAFLDENWEKDISNQRRQVEEQSEHKICLIERKPGEGKK
jgi:hypothetical protein